MTTLATPRPFRFGIATTQAPNAQMWKAKAQRVEAAGYSTLLLPDMIGPAPAPLTALAIAAASTTTLQVGTWVLNNEFRNPVILAREATTLDLLSDGRFQLGLGAGRPDNGYASLGIPAEPAAVRVSRLAESVRIINALFRGEQVSVTGTHYTLTAAALLPPPPRKVPVLLAAGARRMIELAAAEADTVVFSTFSASELAQLLHRLKAAAGERFPRIELALRFRFAPPRVHAPAQTSEAPNLLTGPPEAMITHLEQVRERFGISYIVVDDDTADLLTPVVTQLAGT